MNLTLTDEQAWKGRQSLYITRLATADAYPEGTRQFRTQLRRDSYDEQSYARVELWTPNGWTVVVTLAGEHPVMANLPSHAMPEGPKRKAAFDALRQVGLMLETQAEDVTR